MSRETIKVHGPILLGKQRDGEIIVIRSETSSIIKWSIKSICDVGTYLQKFSKCCEEIGMEDAIEGWSKRLKKRKEATGWRGTYSCRWGVYHNIPNDLADDLSEIIFRNWREVIQLISNDEGM